MRTNSKEVKKQIRQHIIDCVTDENEKEYKTFDKAKKRLFDEFTRCANYPTNVHNFPNDQNRFSDYLSGLPFNFEFTNYDIAQYLNNLGINSTGKKYSPDKSLKLYHSLIWSEIRP